MSFTELKVLHEELNELFLRHQEALLGGDLALAASRLDSYEEALRAHIELEEKDLMSIYRWAGRIPGGPEEFFTGEHAKLLEMLNRCRTSLEEIGREVGSPNRGIIRLFDLEAAFKSLTEHHHQREENIFFPALDRVATDEEKQAILDVNRKGA